MKDVDLSCRCGEIRGRVAGVSPRTVNRVICYCADCQAFAHHIGCAELLDEHGGSDIVQVAPGSLTFTKGDDEIAGIRLSPKGLYRYYARCCKTPLGNTLDPKIPYVGIARVAFQAGDGLLGKAEIANTKGAIGKAPTTTKLDDARMVAKVVRRLLGWKVRGKSWPHPFFDRRTGAPSRELTVLSREERDRLRPLCGPRRS